MGKLDRMSENQVNALVDDVADLLKQYSTTRDIISELPIALSPEDITLLRRMARQKYPKLPSADKIRAEARSKAWTKLPARKREAITDKMRTSHARRRAPSHE